MIVIIQSYQDCKEVEMIINFLFVILILLVVDLFCDLLEDECYCCLFQVLCDLLFCDVIVLLCLDGEYLILLVVDGFSLDIFGWCFWVGEYLCFEVFLECCGLICFFVDCGLFDFYDGLVEGFYGYLEIYDCLGCLLYFDDQFWGLLILDIFDLLCFVSVDLDILEVFVSFVVVMVKVSEWMCDLICCVEDEYQCVEVYFEVVGEWLWEMIGQSVVYKVLLEEICLVVNSDLSVLIIGEIGVGKELVV